MNQLFTRIGKAVLLLLTCCISVTAFAQGTISGVITDEENGEALPGVSILVKGTTTGTTTDINGNYSLDLPEHASILIFSFIGYLTTEVEINDRSTIDVSLAADVETLQEVVVVGYGTKKKVNLTGAVSAVEMDETLGNRPVSTTGTLLQGIVPGLQVDINSGEPGASTSFNIRGATSINTSGNSMKTQGPLILVDNVPFNGGINMLDPNNIESISVLKDAGSAAIYGARSAFGVILITTKKGAKNAKMKLNYNNNFTFSKPMNLPQKASPMETIQSYIDAGTTGYWTGQDPLVWKDLLTEYNANPSLYPEGYTMVDGIRYQLAETDAVADLLGKTAFQSTHNLSLSGGSDKTTYRLSLGTVNENGIIAPETNQDYYKRFNIRSVVTSDVTDWLNLQMDASYKKSIKSYPTNDGLNASVNLPPYVPLSDSIEIDGKMYVNGTPKNKIALTDPNIDRYDNLRLTGRTILTPVKGLKITGEYTLENIRRNHTTSNKFQTFVEPRNFTVNETGGNSFLRKLSANHDYHMINIFADYTKSVGDHNFSLLAGYNQEERNSENHWVRNELMINDDLQAISLGTGMLTGGDDYEEYAVRGYFGRINYDYKGKYLLELNARRDASSKFPEGHRSGIFPSLSIGWRITEEGFMKNIGPWLTEFKIRGSYGSVGNQNIPSYEFVPGMTSYYASWMHNGEQLVSLNPPPLVSNSFTWATVQTQDIGADFGFLDNRLTGSFDLYQRDTKDMLYAGIQLPAVLGEDAPLRNVAELRSTGYELTVNWRSRIGEVRYNIGINFYDYQSEITKISNKEGLLSQYYEGQKLGEMWGYTTERLYTVDDFVEGTLGDDLTGGVLKEGIPKPEGINPNPGDVMYKDLNNDKIISPGAGTLEDPGDRSIIANNSDRFQFGINGGVSWRNFSFSFLITGVGKNEQWRENIMKFPGFYGFGTMYSHQTDYWTPDNQDAYFPRIYDQAGGNTSYNHRAQTKYMYNGAFLKVRNLSLAYTIPKHILSRVKLQSLQVFCSVENPFIFDHMQEGLQPDVVQGGRYGMGYPFMRMTSFGINLTL